MKLFLDTKSRRFVKSAASNVALQTLHLKRRDQVPLEIVYVSNNAVVAAPTGTTTTVGLKAKFSDANFLAFAAPGTNTLNLNTEPVEAAFSSNPASLPALLEVRWSAPGESLRTATLQVELQNSVILGTEGTPTAIPDLKATQAEAEAGTSNETWMTPLRAWDAIRAWAAANFSWANLAGKPTSFPPSSHTHTASQITDFSAAVVAAAPPTTDASLLTSGTLADARLSATVTASLAKADTASQPGHGHAISDVANLTTALAEKATITSVTAESQARASADTDLQNAVDGKSPLGHTHAAAEITDLATAVATLSPTPTTPANSGLAISGNSIATSYNSSIGDGVVSVSVGGAPAAPASSWKSKNIVQVLDDILFPTILASVGSAKSITLGVSGASGVLEIGSPLARTLTATFTRGTILNGNGSTNANPLVGEATGFTFTGTGITSTTQPGNTLTFTTAVVSGSNNWAVTATHAAGTGDYFDNKGVSGTNLATSRAAGTATDSTSAPTITGVHPFYHLKSASPITAAAMVAAIENGTATKVIADSTGTLTIPYAPSAQFIAIAYPSTSTTKTRYFVTALDTGAITVVFAPVATLSVTTALWTQSYKIHTSSGALTNSAANIELRNS
jgi:hypothetical protein